MDCNPPGSSVHGLLQARILEWVAIPNSRGSSWPREWTQVSCITGRFFTIWATRKAISSVQFSCSVIRLFVTSWTAALLASLSITNSWNLFKLMSIESVMPSNLSSSVVPFSSCLQSFLASGSFPMSQFFTSGGQSIGSLASASVVPMNIQNWFPLGLTGLISL